MEKTQNKTYYIQEDARPFQKTKAKIN